MGATEFTSTAAGTTAAEAFDEAVANARYEYGSRGYTGTLAEKDSFTVINSTPQTSEAANEIAEQMLAADDDRIADKWGPAGAIAVEGGQWLFFGFASS